MNTFELKLSQISVYELNINELFKAFVNLGVELRGTLIEKLTQNKENGDNLIYFVTV